MDNGFPIFLISHAVGNKPATEVAGNCEGYRMRNPYERVHLRADDDDKHCTACGVLTGKTKPWFDSRDRWEGHSYRCTA